MSWSRVRMCWTAYGQYTSEYVIFFQVVRISIFRNMERLPTYSVTSRYQWILRWFMILAPFWTALANDTAPIVLAILKHCLSEMVRSVSPMVDLNSCRMNIVSGTIALTSRCWDHDDVILKHHEFQKWKLSPLNYVIEVFCWIHFTHNLIIISQRDLKRNIVDLCQMTHWTSSCYLVFQHAELQC